MIKYPHLLGVERDDNADDAEKFVCLLNENEENGVKAIDKVRHRLFVKAKCDLEMLPPTHNALELHIKRSNNQAKICKGVCLRRSRLLICIAYWHKRINKTATYLTSFVP